MNPPSEPDSAPSDRKGPMDSLFGRLAVRHALAGELLSVAHLIRAPVLNSSRNRVGRVSDIVVRWATGVEHPPLVGVLVRVGKGVTFVAARDFKLEQSGVRLHSAHFLVSDPVHHDGDVGLARDVLDHQLVDVVGVQVVRAADVYLAKLAGGWELAGIDVGMRSLVRRLLPRRRVCPSPDRAIDWADLQAFVARHPDDPEPGPANPATAASTVGSSVQLATPTANLRKLKAKEVLVLLDHLNRSEQAQLTTIADSGTMVEALREFEPAKREALLATLDETNQARLSKLLKPDKP
jgi:hypothetical protein